jgi:hypothetical protein
MSRSKGVVGWGKKQLPPGATGLPGGSIGEIQFNLDNINFGGISDLTSYIAATINQTTVSNDGDGTITIGTVQDINTISSPTFANITITSDITTDQDILFTGSNIALTVNGLPALTSGAKNVILGDDAGLNIGSASRDVFIGERAGLNVTSGSNNIVMGRDSGLSLIAQNSAIVLGFGADTNQGDAIVIGVGGNVTGNNGISFGANSTCSGSLAICMGDAATAAGDDSVVLGCGATDGGNNSHFIVGGNVGPLTQMYIGRGITAVSPSTDVTWNTTGGLGTNIKGSNLNIAGGRSTGNLGGGSVTIQTTEAGASGSGLNALKDRLIVNDLKVVIRDSTDVFDIFEVNYDNNTIILGDPSISNGITLEAKSVTGSITLNSGSLITMSTDAGDLDITADTDITGMLNVSGTGTFENGIIDIGDTGANGVIKSNFSIDIIIDENSTGGERFRVGKNGSTSGSGITLMTLSPTGIMADVITYKGENMELSKIFATTPIDQVLTGDNQLINSDLGSLLYVHGNTTGNPSTNFTSGLKAGVFEGQRLIITCDTDDIVPTGNRFDIDDTVAGSSAIQWGNALSNPVTVLEANSIKFTWDTTNSLWRHTNL